MTLKKLFYKYIYKITYLKGDLTMLKKFIAILVLLSVNSLIYSNPEMLKKFSKRFELFITQKNSTISKGKILERANRMIQASLIRKINNPHTTQLEGIDLILKSSDLGIITTLYGSFLAKNFENYGKALSIYNHTGTKCPATHKALCEAHRNLHSESKYFKQAHAFSQNSAKLALDFFKKIESLKQK